MVSTLGASEHLVLGTTSLTFTPNDWNIPQPVMVSAIPYANLTEANGVRVLRPRRIPCTWRSIARVIRFTFAIVRDRALISSSSQLYLCVGLSEQHGNFVSVIATQLSPCWNATGVGIAVASLTAAGHQPVLTEFTTPESGAYNDITKIQRLRHYGSQWSVVDRYHLAVDGTDRAPGTPTPSASIVSGTPRRPSS